MKLLKRLVLFVAVCVLLLVASEVAMIWSTYREIGGWFQ